MPTAAPLTFSLVRDDLPYRLMRRVGLIPAEGLGVARRAVFFGALAWLPIAVWAVLTDRALPGGEATEPLLQHFGVHVRGLFAIPMLIVAQGLAHNIFLQLLPWFVKSGVVPPTQVQAFDQAIRNMFRLRAASWPWLLLACIAVVWSSIAPEFQNEHVLTWAGEPGSKGPGIGFGGLWYLFVTRPMYVLLWLAWLWRVALLTRLFWDIGKLDLRIVPTHFDRCGGLGFVERFTFMFSLVIFTVCAVLASGWAHEALYHGVTLQSHLGPLAALYVQLLLIFCAPLLAFFPALSRSKRFAELEYGTVVGRQGALVRERWIEKRTVDDPVLDAPEIGPVADAIALGEAAARMRPAPIGARALTAILVPATLPFVALLLTRYPLDEILLKLLQGLA